MYESYSVIGKAITFKLILSEISPKIDFFLKWWDRVPQSDMNFYG